MIKTEQQLSIARDKLEDVEMSLASIQDADERAPYEELAASLQEDIDRYTAIRDGLLSDFQIWSVDDLGEALVHARLATRLTQRELAERIDVREQQIQRWERGKYETAALWRLAEVADALEYELVAVMRPRNRVSPSPLVVRPTFWGGGSLSDSSPAYALRVLHSDVTASEHDSPGVMHPTRVSGSPRAHVPSH